MLQNPEFSAAAQVSHLKRAVLVFTVLGEGFAAQLGSAQLQTMQNICSCSPCSLIALIKSK